jgi:hypothetical protein
LVNTVSESEETSFAGRGEKQTMTITTPPPREGEPYDIGQISLRPASTSDLFQSLET